MDSVSWITSLSCTNPCIQSTEVKPTKVFQWLRFMFLSPCPQRALLSCIDVLFLLVLLVFALTRLHKKFTSRTRNSDSEINKPLIDSNGVQFRTNTLFKLTLTASGLLVCSCLVTCILVFNGGFGSESLWNVFDGSYWFLQLLVHAVILVLIIHEKRFRAVTHLVIVRVFWVVDFSFTALFFTSGVIRFAATDYTFIFDDIVSAVNLPLSLALLFIGIRGSTGIITEEIKSHEPLLSNVSGFASASFVSKAFWLWLNPLLTKGSKTALEIDDVPALSPQHSAENLCRLFEANWPKPDEKCKHPVLITLLRCFYKELAFTAFLAIIRVSVMYVGPTLITRFVDYTSGKRSSPYEGYYLVSILLIAKFVEVLSAHQFNFNSQKLGMLLRSTLITSIYKKGLRLSCTARQDHGVGQIVNYMVVDAQQLADMVLQLHSIWLMPLQITIALFLLYNVLNASAFTAFIGIAGVMLFVVFGIHRDKNFQINLMANRDLRMKATSEMLNYMRVIKLQAWEEQFENQIQNFRKKEFEWLSKFMYSMSTNIIMLWSAPSLTSTLTFATALFFGVQLDAGTVFTTTSVFKTLQDPIRQFPQSMISLSQAIISLGRLDRYMLSKELVEESVERENCSECSIAVEVRDGTFSWDDECEDSVLSDINFKVNKGELTAIVGTVGSGKSSLLASILGEMHKISGQVKVCGTTAYVAQTSWIQNGTIEENILYGLPMDKEKYKEVVRVCCLEKDLEMMDNGDQTEIGERGINLSGGQKQRIQLARAVYQDCDIYLLDDVFSAVDAHTGSYIFKECVRGALDGKTILLVTHQVDFLHNVDLICVMRDGTIVQSGKYNEILQSGLDFGALVAAHETSMEIVEAGNLIVNETTTESTTANTHSPRTQTPATEPGRENGVYNQPISDKKSSKLVEAEQRETGKLGFQVYKEYCTAAFGWWGVTIAFLVSLMWQGSLMASDYWLAYETSADREPKFKPVTFISVYAIITAVSLVLLSIRAFFITEMGLKAAQVFFKGILHSIFHAPMSFFDTTPSGRILSRASSDQSNLDVLIPFMLGITVPMYITLLSIIIIACQYSWPTVFLLIPLAWINLWYRRFFLATSRELTRLDSITKAPVIHHFSESITGVMTIRAFKKQNVFCSDNMKRVNSNLQMDFHNYSANEWFGFRLELLGSFVLCASALFLILLPSSVIKPENVGLSLSYGLSLNGVIFFAVYVSCFVENKMISVERVKQFTNIPSEAAWKIKDRLPPPNWPSRGDIHIMDLQVKYRPNTPLVLKGITLSIKGGEKIGVVGRTGSGKSTLIQVFFRLVEPTEGKIIVDGIDICTLGLHDLRSRFGIIPQEPVLFEGTVRSNVDPFGQYTDEQIWKGLECCQLKDNVAAKPEKLDSPVVDNGENWSVGQRQLLCLGRVMLNRSRLLFMDEATASVDSQTDSVIQKIIRDEFAACTIISIAHRIPTVMDCDRVLVIDSGLAKEFDRPSQLLERPSLFGALVQEYVSRSAGL